MDVRKLTEVAQFSSEKMQKLNLFESSRMFCDLYCLEPGQSQKVHSHRGATKFYFVLEGKASLTIGSETRELGEGDLAWSAPDEEHGLDNRSAERTVLLVAMAPNPNLSQ